MTVLQRNLKEWQEWLWTYVCECRGKATKVGQQLECQEQCIDHIPYYLSGLSRAQFFRQPFSKQLHTWQRGVSRIKSFICRRACLVFVIVDCHCFQPHFVPAILLNLHSNTLDTLANSFKHYGSSLPLLDSYLFFIDF